ncbi:MAG: hypothetical protein AAFV95_09165 [Bacteroidota bacterium]
MVQKTATFQRNLDDAVMEYKKMACPNPDCNDLIESKEKIYSSGKSVLEYACRNPSCEYHKKRRIVRRAALPVVGPASPYPPHEEDEELDFYEIAQTALGILMFSLVLGFVGYLFFG